MYNKEALKKQIREMGILSTDIVMMHTSMKAIGEVEGGADTVIDAFCECLEDGLYLVPTHTWGSVHKDHPVFDVRTERPCVGALPTAAAFRKDGVRSLHPSHSVWAHGKNAAEFVKGEEQVHSPAPKGFLWSKLADVNAKILLVGVGNNKNTFIHSVDEYVDLEDRLSPEEFDVTIIDHEGKEHHSNYRGHCCSKTRDVSQYYVNFEKPLVELGAQTFGKLGDAVVRIVDAKKCRDIVAKIYNTMDYDVGIMYQEIPEAFYK